MGLHRFQRGVINDNVSLVLQDSTVISDPIR